MNNQFNIINSQSSSSEEDINCPKLKTTNRKTRRKKLYKQKKKQMKADQRKIKRGLTKEQIIKTALSKYRKGVLDGHGLHKLLSIQEKNAMLAGTLHCRLHEYM